MDQELLGDVACYNCKGEHFLVDGAGRKFHCHLCAPEAVWNCASCAAKVLAGESRVGERLTCRECPRIGYAYEGFVHLDTDDCLCEHCEMQNMIDRGFCGVL